MGRVLEKGRGLEEMGRGRVVREVLGMHFIAHETSKASSSVARYEVTGEINAEK